jgi:transcriptional regulator with XRE-family HTH domain
MEQDNLARNLRVLRAERGLNIKEASRLSGVTQETISSLEHGQRGAYTSTLYKLAAAYGVTVGDILSGEVGLLTASKAEAPATGPEPYARIPYEPGESLGNCAQARAEALRIMDEAVARGEIEDPAYVVFHYTDDAIELQRLSDAEKDPVYGSWAEYARRFSRRWHKKIEARDFTRGEFDEFLAAIEDFTDIQARLGLREKKERPYYDETFGPVMGWSIRLITGLFTPMIKACAEMFDEDEEDASAIDELANVIDFAMHKEQRAERYKPARPEKGVSNG